MSGLRLEPPNDLLEAFAQRVAATILEQIEQAPTTRWLTVDRAADYLGRTPEAVRGLVKRGELTPYKPDGRLQFDREELDRWMRGDPDA